jgi:hypothetical protein
MAHAVPLVQTGSVPKVATGSRRSHGRHHLLKTRPVCAGTRRATQRDEHLRMAHGRCSGRLRIPCTFHKYCCMRG